MSEKIKINGAQTGDSQKLPSHPQNYARSRRPLPFLQRRNFALLHPRYPSIAAEQNHIQVIQNKQSAPSLSVNFLRYRRSAFSSRIRRFPSPAFIRSASVLVFAPWCWKLDAHGPLQRVR
jgi:hypothetical protein